MSTVLQPRTGHGDVVSGGLAVTLDKNWEVLSILSVPGLERLEELETVTSWRDGNANGATLGRWCLVGVLSWVEASALWKSVSGGSLEEELLAIRTGKLVGERVEVKASGDGHGNDEIGGSDEGVGSGVGIVTSSEVTVVGRDDGVSLTLLDVLAVPLANAGATGVGKNHAAELLKSGKLSITLNGGADLLGTGGDGEQRLGLDAVVESVTSDRGRARHILVGRVGARTDQTNLKLLRPVVGLDSLAELGDGGGQIGGEWTVDVGLELRQVDLDKLIVLGTLILPQLLCVSTGEVSDVLALGDGKVIVHAVVEGEQRGGGTDLSTHVADGGHTGTRDTVNARAVVFDNGTSSTLDGQDSSNLKNDVYVATYISNCSPNKEFIQKLTLGRGPSGHFTSKFNTNDLRGLKLPRKVGHDINGVSSADTDGAHTQTTGIGSVRVGTDQKTTGESVVLEENLVNDTGSWLPEANVVLGASGGKEVVDLLVDADGTGQILVAANLGLNQMVAVNGGRVGNRGHARGHELEDGHLSSGILARNTIRAQSQVRGATLNLLSVRIIQMRVEDLLGVGERPVQASTDNGQVLGHLLVVDEVALLVDVLVDLLVKARITGSCHCAAHAMLDDSPPLGGTKKLSRRQHCEVVWSRECV